jgi:hypothetical protein
MSDSREVTPIHPLAGEMIAEKQKRIDELERELNDKSISTFILVEAWKKSVETHRAQLAIAVEALEYYAEITPFIGIAPRALNEIRMQNKSAESNGE